MNILLIFFFVLSFSFFILLSNSSIFFIHFSSLSSTWNSSVVLLVTTSDYVKIRLWKQQVMVKNNKYEKHELLCRNNDYTQFINSMSGIFECHPNKLALKSHILIFDDNFLLPFDLALKNLLFLHSALFIQALESLQLCLFLSIRYRQWKKTIIYTHTNFLTSRNYLRQSHSCLTISSFNLLMILDGWVLSFCFLIFPSIILSFLSNFNNYLLIF